MWLEVLVESGVTTAARIVADMDADLVVAALAQHLLVFDVASISPVGPDEGEEFDVVSSLDTGIGCGDRGVPGIAAKQSESWDAIVAVLLALDAEYQHVFGRVMRGCRSLSNSAPEPDGLDDLLGAGEQVMFDLGAVRERRRERQGYATPAEARSFLQMSRRLSLRHDAAPTANPIARAYFRGVDFSQAVDTNTDSRRLPAGAPEPPAPEDADAVAAIVDIILESGVVDPRGRTGGSAPTPPRALLEESHGETPHLTPLQAHMQFAGDRDAAAFSVRSRRSPTSLTRSWSAVHPDASADPAAGLGRRGRRLQPRSRELANRWLTRPARHGSTSSIPTVFFRTVFWSSTI